MTTSKAKVNSEQGSSIDSGGTAHQPSEVMTFHFSEEKNSIRNIIQGEDPWFVANDICKVLGMSDTNVALRKLDSEEKLTRKIYGSGQKRKMWMVNESGLYSLILRSNKPQAKAFKKWITSEVLPSLRKKGYYGQIQRKDGKYIDARDIPYTLHQMNDYAVRTVSIDGVLHYSVNDVNRAIGSSTDASQVSKQLNKVRSLAVKIWLYGNTHPAWFTTQLGVKLILSGSRILKDTKITQASLFPRLKLPEDSIPEADLAELGESMYNFKKKEVKDV